MVRQASLILFLFFAGFTAAQRRAQSSTYRRPPVQRPLSSTASLLRCLPGIWSKPAHNWIQTSSSLKAAVRAFRCRVFERACEERCAVSQGLAPRLKPPDRARDGRPGLDRE